MTLFVYLFIIFIMSVVVLGSFLNRTAEWMSRPPDPLFAQCFDPFSTSRGCDEQLLYINSAIFIIVTTDLLFHYIYYAPFAIRSLHILFFGGGACQNMKKINEIA